MKRVIVTGAGGFIGRTVVQQLYSQRCQVLAISRTLPAYLEMPGVLAIQMDLSDVDALPQRLNSKWDIWIHLAWRGTYGQDRRDSRVQIQNLQDFQRCVCAAGAVGCTRFVGIGSIMEIERNMDPRAGEKYCRRGDYIYALAKTMSHAILFTEAPKQGMDAVWCTLTNVYGVGDESGRLINYAVNTLLDGQEPRFSSATQMYDFVYVTDAASAVITCALAGRSFEEYLIGSGHAAPLRNFLDQLHDKLAPSSVFHYGSLPAGGPDLPAQVFSTEKIREQLGWRPCVSFGEGVQSLCDWLIKRRENNE